MYVVTFYSYQGGSGQTTALTNVAADLAMRGRKVLLVDFDLGKPVLSSFGPLRPARRRAGVVEFVTEYLNLGRAPALEEYVYQARIAEGIDRQVWVMPAGRADDNYWDALPKLDWQDLYAVRDGFLFMEDLKAQWREVLQVDYVLIDTPAGITDITGICTRQLADDVVFLIVPNDSDLTGTERVMREVFAESIAEGARRIDIHLTTSMMPDLDGDEMLAARELRTILEPDWMISIMFDLTAELPYDPALLRGRQVVMSRRPGSRLAHQYRQLANAIVLGNCTQDREGAKAFLKELQLNPDWVVGEEDQGETVKRWFDCTQRLDRIIEFFTAKRDEHGRVLVDPGTAERDAEVLGQAASCLFLAGSRVKAAEVLGVAVEQAPGNAALLWQQASYRFKGGDCRFVEDLMTLLDLAPQPPQNIPSLEELINSSKEPATEGQNRLPPLDTEALRHDALLLAPVLGPDAYVVSAVRLLRQHAPGRLEEALQSRGVRSLSDANRDRLLVDDIMESSYPDRSPESLIRCKRFPQVIARLEESVRESDPANVGSAFHLAMAYWAVGKEVEATRVSREALKPWLVEGTDQLLDVFDITRKHMVMLQLFALLAFRADNLEVAKMLVFRLVGDLSEQFQGTTFFSYWRYRPVRFSQFREDCRELQQMIQQRIAGVAISLPPFLSRSLSGV